MKRRVRMPLGDLTRLVQKMEDELSALRLENERLRRKTNRLVRKIRKMRREVKV